jgi:hypothetical protein
MSSIITSSILNQSLSWVEYYAIIKGYIETDNKPEVYKDAKMLKYTTDNLKRMDHVLKTIHIESKLYNAMSAISDDLIWLVLAEPWCGDVSQVLPALYTISTCSGHIQFRVLQSDARPEILDAYLTGTSRSIPKLICLRADTLEEIGTWGPRPVSLQKIVMENKDRADITFGDKVRMIHDWYAADKTMSIQDEFINLTRKWSAGETSIS